MDKNNLKEYYRNYRLKHKEEIDKKRKEWFLKNKERLLQKKLASNRKKRTWIENIMAKNLELNNILYDEKQRVGKYFPDFLINNKIIIECDGEHWYNENKDKIRDEELKKLGFIILRFKGKEINYNINECINKIKTII